MAPRKKAPKRYYDPGKRPYPARKEGAEWGSRTSNGPTGNSRQQRRARARLSWSDQYELAKSQRFPVPSADEVKNAKGGLDPRGTEQFIGAKTALGWIKTWEDRYADR